MNLYSKQKSINLTLFCFEYGSQQALHLSSVGSWQVPIRKSKCEADFSVYRRPLEAPEGAGARPCPFHLQNSDFHADLSINAAVDNPYRLSRGRNIRNGAFT